VGEPTEGAWCLDRDTHTHRARRSRAREPRSRLSTWQGLSGALRAPQRSSTGCERPRYARQLPPLGGRSGRTSRNTPPGTAGCCAWPRRASGRGHAREMKLDPADRAPARTPRPSRSARRVDPRRRRGSSGPGVSRGCCTPVLTDATWIHRAASAAIASTVAVRIMLRIVQWPQRGTAPNRTGGALGRRLALDLVRRMCNDHERGAPRSSG
jgi:hypothetical protein